MTNLLSETYALAADAADPLAHFRSEFLIPRHVDGDITYFCGNSLGLQPRGTGAIVQGVLDDWAMHGVEGHFRGDRPWMYYHTLVRDGLAAVVGAEPIEVVAMNSLTANLHFLMASFYRPIAGRSAILMEAGAFPSDRHAVQSQIRFHGFDPATDLIEIEPDTPGGVISMASIERTLANHGKRVALVLWPGVQYRSGQAFDIKEVTRLAKAQGCVMGVDLAHAVGNLALELHDSNVDFAVWCHYKYLNCGPGAVAGAFVHAQHAHAALPRLAGWWGHDPSTRFQMRPEFVPTPGADGWQLSNPPVLALAPLIASLDIFQRANMQQLRKKSIGLTAYLESLIHAELSELLEVVTPADPTQRGCQLSLRVRAGREHGRALFEHLASKGVLGDWREPDVIRISPTPLYNRHVDVLRFVGTCRQFIKAN